MTHKVDAFLFNGTARMNGSDLYDSLQIASNFMEQAEKLVAAGEYEAAFVALEKAKSYAFQNAALLDDIQLRHEAVSNAHRHYIKQLEDEAANLFNQEPFNSQKAREILHILEQQSDQSELAQTLWQELSVRETAERERRLVQDFQEELQEIWQQARHLETKGQGSDAIAEYERALVEASKKVADAPEIIPLQRLKLAATGKLSRAKEKWEEIRGANFSEVLLE